MRRVLILVTMLGLAGCGWFNSGTNARCNDERKKNSITGAESTVVQVRCPTDTGDTVIVPPFPTS